jgi:hypothetical protein
MVACAVGVALIVAVVAGLVAVADVPLMLAPALAGAGLIVVALDTSGVGAAATPFEAVLFGCAGVAFAVALDAPALALALPLFVAVIDTAQAAAGGNAGLFALSVPRPGDALALELPDWGTGLVVARLSVPDVVFLAAFAAYARRFELRERAAEAGMLCALLAAAAAEILFDAQLPTLALLAIGYLAPNLDRLGGLLARVRAE